MFAAGQAVLHYRRATSTEGPGEHGWISLGIWMHQDVKYDFTADLTGMGDRPELK